MNHYIYRIDRPSTGEWYVGIRSCRCAPLEDVRYMGSGTRVLRIDNSELVKTVLVQVETREEAQRIERGLVGPDQVADPLCLNLVCGGLTGDRGEEFRNTMRKAWAHKRGVPLPADVRKKMSEALVLRHQKYPPDPEKQAEAGRTGWTDERRAALAARNRARKRPRS